MKKSAYGTNVKQYPKRAGISFPMNPDQADIYGRTDFHSDNSYVLDIADYRFPDFKILVPRTENHRRAPSVAEDLMPRDIMASELKH